MKQKLMNFMYGRYGNDELNICLLVLYFLCMILSFFFSVFSYIGLIIIIYALYRMFSKNIYKRRQENAKILPYFSFAKAKVNDKGKNKLFMCPKCKRTLRIPKGKGKVTISCPCGNRIKGKS